MKLVNWFFLAAILLSAVFGFIAPTLISEEDDISVLVGVILLSFTAYVATWLFVKKFPALTKDKK